jgi:hypothetical protein
MMPARLASRLVEITKKTISPNYPPRVVLMNTVAAVFMIPFWMKFILDAFKIPL